MCIKRKENLSLGYAMLHKGLNFTVNWNKLQHQLHCEGFAIVLVFKPVRLYDWSIVCAEKWRKYQTCVWICTLSINILHSCIWRNIDNNDLSGHKKLCLFHLSSDLIIFREKQTQTLRNNFQELNFVDIVFSFIFIDRTNIYIIRFFK